MRPLPKTHLPAVVPLSGDLVHLVWRVLDYYGNLCTYQGERTGGVLKGCPRGPAPIADELVFEARQAKARLAEHVEAFLATAPNEPAGVRDQGREQDAERYRWLRNHCTSKQAAALVTNIRGNNMDHAIDAAMAQGKEGTST